MITNLQRLSAKAFSAAATVVVPSADFVFALASIVILAGCEIASSARSPFDIKDSGVPAAEGQLGWLDNERIIFTGYEPGRYRTNPDGSQILVINSIFIWDTSQNKVTKYASIEGPVDLCVHKGSIFYTRYVEQEKALVLISGKIGEEQKTHLPEKRWFNPLSCQYSSTRPSWAVDGRDVVPLLEEHGYLDKGVWSGPDKYENTPVRLYTQGATKSIVLPMGRYEFRIVQYAEFEKRYFMSRGDYVNKKTGRVYGRPWPQDALEPVWWLTPDGIVTEIKIPYGPWRASSVEYFPTRDGVFLVSHNIAADSGGYLMQGKTVKKLITAVMQQVKVSPNGCKVAFVHDPYDRERGKERFNRITVKMIDLCQGEAQ